MVDPGYNCANQEQQRLLSLLEINDFDDDDKNPSLNSINNDYSSCLLSTDSGIKNEFCTDEIEKSKCCTSNSGFGKRKIAQMPEINENEPSISAENMLFDFSDKKSITNEMYSYLKNIHLEKKFFIKVKYELGNLTELFLNKHLSKFFFLSIISYLFGDLIIYNSMMAKSLRELAW